MKSLILDWSFLCSISWSATNDLCFNYSCSRFFLPWIIIMFFSIIWSLIFLSSKLSFLKISNSVVCNFPWDIFCSSCNLRSAMSALACLSCSWNSAYIFSRCSLCSFWTVCIFWSTLFRASSWMWFFWLSKSFTCYLRLN